MQVRDSFPESQVHFDEPVKSLLSAKGRAVRSISPEATVFEAIELMAAHHIGALVVLSAKRLDGIISERDYARKVILKGRQSPETRVHEIMTKSVLYVNPDTSIDECMRLMTSRRVRHLPVLEGKTVIGMVSMGDLLKWIIDSHEQTIHHLESYIVGRYPG